MDVLVHQRIYSGKRSYLDIIKYHYPLKFNVRIGTTNLKFLLYKNHYCISHFHGIVRL